MEQQALEVPALHDKLALAATAAEAQASRIASLESMLAKYRSEVDKLELALAAAEFKAEVKEELEMKEEFVSTGGHMSAAHPSPCMYGSEEEVLQSHAICVSPSKDATPAAGALDVRTGDGARTPCFSPQGYHRTSPPSTGWQSTECPTTAPSCMPTPTFTAHVSPSYSSNSIGSGQASLTPNAMRSDVNSAWLDVDVRDDFSEVKRLQHEI